MLLNDVSKLLLTEFRLHFHLEYALFGQVRIYSRVPGLNDLVNVALLHWFSDWNLLYFLGVILEVQDLSIGFVLADH